MHSVFPARIAPSAMIPSLSFTGLLSVHQFKTIRCFLLNGLKWNTGLPLIGPILRSRPAQSRKESIVFRLFCINRSRFIAPLVLAAILEPEDLCCRVRQYILLGFLYMLMLFYLFIALFFYILYFFDLRLYFFVFLAVCAFHQILSDLYINGCFSLF